ncbi:hypothetical protein U9M48_004957 [Paspalum notatum var. saurae]|uniref:SnoaL-like domain-containing protein n=1 Tax=Paspalum notatum var. saurae TaxID=547442 RepID=A0AAQ3PWC5_PASNO
MPPPLPRFRASSSTAVRQLQTPPPSSTTTPSAATTLSAAAAGAVPFSLLPLLNKHPEFSTAAMAGSQATEEKVAAAASQPPAGGSGSVADRIMPHLLNMYGSCATARDFEIYAPNATFEDPLMRAHGVKQIKSSFYSLPKVFGESKITEYTVQETPTGPGKAELVIENKQHYKVLGKAVELASRIRLEVEDGKVVRHEDWWDGKPLKNRHTVAFPLVGRIAEAGRRGAMMLTHALMGFGKDPTTTTTTPQ